MANPTNPERIEAAMRPVEVPHARITLYESYITQSLGTRARRTSDYAREMQAMEALSKKLFSEPAAILDAVLEAALELCKGDSAGVALLEGEAVPVSRPQETDAGWHAPESRFRWIAAAGHLRALKGTITPFDGPSGITVSTQKPQLFRLPDRHFKGLKGTFAPALHEVLLVPWNVPPHRQGTLAVTTHDPHRRFDSEDLRILKELGHFVATAMGKIDPDTIHGQFKAADAAMDIARQLGHHINNPLQAASMALELMADKTKPAEMRERALPVARQQLERITRIVYELLEFHRVPTPDDLASLEDAA
jgi:GAF domain-containing protein